MEDPKCYICKTPIKEKECFINEENNVYIHKECLKLPEEKYLFFKREKEKI